MPVGGAPTALRTALLGPLCGGVPRQRILKQLAFRRAPGPAAPIAEVPVFALAGFGQRAAREWQWRRLRRQKARLPQQHRCAATGDSGTYADGMPGIGDMDMRSRPSARPSALELVHLAPASEPRKQFYHRHGPAFRCGQRNNPQPGNTPAVAADGSTGSAYRQPLCRLACQANHYPIGVGIPSHGPGKRNPPFGGLIYRNPR
jgi:hypothetical protein